MTLRQSAPHGCRHQQLDSTEVGKEIDRMNIHVKCVQPRRTAFDQGPSLIDAGCMKNSKKSRFVSGLVENMRQCAAPDEIPCVGVQRAGEAFDKLLALCARLCATDKHKQHDDFPSLMKTGKLPLFPLRSMTARWRIGLAHRRRAQTQLLHVLRRVVVPNDLRAPLPVAATGMI
jgi:hypothetical protein